MRKRSKKVISILRDLIADDGKPNLSIYHKPITSEGSC